MAKKSFAFLFILIFGSAFEFEIGNSANVLCMFTSSARTQLSVFMAVANTLIERDHNVTIVTTIPIPPQMRNGKQFRHILLEPPAEHKLKLSASLSVSDSGILPDFIVKVNYLLLATLFPSIQRDVLTQAKFKEFLQEDNHFDLMLLGYFHNDFIVGVAGRYRCPIAVITLGSPFGPVSRMIGNPEETSFVPIPLLSKNQPMSFSERTVNFAWTVLEPLVYIYVNWIMEAYYQSLFQEEFFPKYSDLITNVSLVLCNSHFTENPVQPLVPAVIEIGGIQVKEQPDPLPEDIQAFLDSSVNGAILFNIGSKLRGAYLKAGEIAIVLNVLSRLEQNVLWEWEADEAPPKIKNILFRRSLPIDDIFFHPKLQLFITDGRYNILFAAAIHGIAMLGIPLYSEGYYCIEAMKNKGYGVSVDISTLSEESLEGAIARVIKSPHINKKVKNFSKLYRDRPLSARESAAFWLEYVIRHRGALHMQSPLVHMDWIQRWNIDIILTIWVCCYAAKKLVKFIVIFVRLFLNYKNRGLESPVKYKLE